MELILKNVLLCNKDKYSGLFVRRYKVNLSLFCIMKLAQSCNLIYFV